MSRKVTIPAGQTPTAEQRVANAEQRLAIIGEAIRNNGRRLAALDCEIADTMDTRRRFVAAMEREAQRTTKEPEPVLFGAEKAECERLGGYSRFKRLRDGAERDGLDLTKPDQRGRCRGAVVAGSRDHHRGREVFRRGASCGG
jgi:hypothetical protein